VIKPEPEPIAALVVMLLLPPVADSVTVPDPVADTAPLTVIESVFVTVIFPPLALLVMPVIVRGAPVSVKAMFPLVVFVALKPVTALLPFVSVLPPTELVVSVVPRIAADCVIAPPAVRVIVFVVCAAATSKPVASR
jgi:hypothetical protein